MSSVTVVMRRPISSISSHDKDARHKDLLFQWRQNKTDELKLWWISTLNVTTYLASCRCTSFRWSGVNVWLGEGVWNSNVPGKWLSLGQQNQCSSICMLSSLCGETNRFFVSWYLCSFYFPQIASLTLHFFCKIGHEGPWPRPTCRQHRC